MSFETPISIKEAIDNIHRKKYLLPAIQREFVWSTEQIEKIFDSLMRDYPISSFLFWVVENENVSAYKFYEFLREYHERDNKHNPKADIQGENGIIAILDGQQRLTSLYIGLKGSYADKKRNKRWDNDSSFPKRTLCINLVAPPKDEDLEYDFKFLTEKEYKQNDENHFWFVVGNILTLNEPVDVNDYWLEKDIPSQFEREKARFANKALFKLHDVIHKNKSINFFLEKGESLDKVLNIFIRVNSGGTQLNHSDLLLSIATSQWKEKDAKEEITSLVDDINAIGGGFNINKDFVLKNCLVLSDFKDIAFKVDNFNQENMFAIERKWEDIAKATKSAFILLDSFGYHGKALTSNNALIPIATYLHKIGSPKNFSESSKYQDDRKKIFKWLAMVLLGRTFGGQSDNVLRSIREVINTSEDEFPFDGIIEKLKGSPKAISFNDDEIDNLLYYKYNQSYTYSTLALLYPSLDFKNRFHQDHIFPKKLFTKTKLRKHGMSDDVIDFYHNNYNCIANLQLLEGVPNLEKGGEDFNLWIEKEYPDRGSRNDYMRKHYIPDVNFSFDNFREFIEKRKKLIVCEFKRLLT